MTFALSGSTITQTGTDADLSGLAGISGVAVVSSGSGFFFYSLTGRLLVIDGALTIDPRKECLSTDRINAIQVNAGGVLNLGVQITSGSYVYESLGVGLVFTGVRTNSGSATTDWYTPGISGFNAAGLLVFGTFNWRGATAIARNNGFGFEAGSTINIKNGVWLGALAGGGSAPTGRRVISGFQTSGATVDGFRKQGGELIFGANTATGSIFSKVVREDSVNAIFPNRLNNITFSNIDIGQKSNTPDVTIQSEGGAFTNTTIVNSASGTNLNIYGGETATDIRNQGYISIRRRIFVNIKKAGVAVQNAIVFVRDTTNGQRKNLNGINDTADKTYRNLTDASGNTGAFDLVCGIVNVAGANAQGSTNTGAYTVDLRGNSNVLGDDTFTIHALGYGISYLSTPVPVAGINVLSPSFSVLPDLQISQANTATVSGYATQSISRFEDVYDFAAYDKTLVSGLELPTIATRVFESGNGIQGTINYNFRIDSALTGVSINHTSSLLSVKALTATSSKYTDINIASGRNITLAQTGNFNQVSFAVLSTNIVTVAAGNTNLSAWTFAAGAIINVSSSTAIVTVAADQLANVTAGAGVTLQVPPTTLTVLGFQPLSSITISQAGRTLRQLNDTSPPFTWAASGISIPSSVSLTIAASGFETYSQAVAITSADQSVTVAQLREGSSDTYNGSQIKFKTLMLSDAGFKRILNAATGSFVDDAANCRLASFESASVKASWNLLMAATVPTTAEITAWQGYLVASSYTAIAFANTTGVVS